MNSSGKKVGMKYTQGLVNRRTNIRSKGEQMRRVFCKQPSPAHCLFDVDLKRESSANIEIDISLACGVDHKYMNL